MPARTVIFDSNRKHDGLRVRDLNPGEFKLCMEVVQIFGPCLVHKHTNVLHRRVCTHLSSSSCM